MIRKSLLELIFKASQMQRWNDKLRPIELYELDKQGHKMIAAYLLGKFHEEDTGFDWVEVIEGGIFEFFQRIIITDLKPPVIYQIRSNPEKYEMLNEYVYERLEPIISPLDEDFTGRFRNYFKGENATLNRRLLGAAHVYASRWEFQIIQRANPEGFEIERIGREFQTLIEGYGDLKGMGELLKYRHYRDFLDLCGELRFQTRWANLHRVPKTSVAGHSFFVAVVGYLCSILIGACPKRRMNNFFTGLFHDLPEVLTRDIISPVKRSVEGLEAIIKEFEKEKMDETVYELLPKEWHEEMRLFTENEFQGVVYENGVSVPMDSATIHARYNQDQYNPRDGELIEAIDRLAAFIEAYMALRNGCRSEEFDGAIQGIKQKYSRTIAGIDFGAILSDFS